MAKQPIDWKAIDPEKVSHAEAERNKRRFMESGGNCCPVCGSDDISIVDGFSSDGGEAWCESECDACGSRWQEIYRLAEVEIIENKRSAA